MTDSPSGIGAGSPPGPHRRRNRLLALVGGAVAAVMAAILVLVFVVAGRGGSGAAGPEAAATEYLAAWGRQDWAAMAALVDQPPADFTATHQAAVSALQISGATYLPGAATRRGGTAEVAYRATLPLRGLGSWDHTGTLHLRLLARQWRVEWTPATMYPGLPAGGRLARDRSWPARGNILGAGGVVLTPRLPVVAIGVQGSRVTAPAQVTGALTAAGADPAAVSTGLAQAAAHPDQFVAVLTVPDDARYEQQLRPQLFPVPGIEFRRSTARQALTPDLASHVVGSVGPVTAEQLATLGSPYLPGDTVGQNGIEQANERQLAGRPGGHVLVLDGRGTVVATAATFPATPGADAQTSIDPHVQQAAEEALNGVAQPAAAVAIRPSTGQVLAVVSRPTATPFNRALEGRYPPGSTFKVVTAAALLGNGDTIDTSATCPPTLVVGGRSFRNFEGEAQANLPLHRAFAASCNTAFIGLARDLPGTALVAAAGDFGFGADPKLGLPAFGGRVPLPQGTADQAATVIGQAADQASPLQMAAVAAAVDAGAYRPPRLVAGAPDDTAAAIPLSPPVVDGLRSMMAEVVASGTGTAAAVSGKPSVSGKTGTAEFGTGKPPATHAWFIGFQGDLAVAVLVEGGGVGGQVAAPLAARFFAAI